MLSALRAFAKSPIATVLLGLLVASFVVWGVKDVFRTTSFTDSVVKAGSRPAITQNQFRDDFERMKAGQERQAGQTLTTEQAVKMGWDGQLLQEMAQGEASAALMSSEGINPADQLIVGEIRKNPNFFNPVTGLFDKQQYLTFLSQVKMTEKRAEGEISDEIATRQYGVALGTALKAPRIYALLQAAYLHEGRDFSWFVISPSAVGAPPKPTDADLNDFIKQNAKLKPEMRQISVVRMSAAAMAQTLTVPEADVQKRFDFAKDSLNVPEKRTVVSIPVKDMKTGAEIAAKLRAGGDPQAIAKAAGLQAAAYPSTPKSAMPDRKVGDAAFGLKLNEVAGPIQGDLGLAVVTVTEIMPGKAVTLDDARAKIEGDLKQEQAKEKIYDVVQKYDDAHSGGSSMVEAAKAAGQKVESGPPISAGGQTEDGGQARLPPKVLQTIFTLPAGGESDVIDLGQGEYWVVHIDKVFPTRPYTLDEKLGPTTVRAEVTKAYMTRELVTRLRAKADALTAEIKSGKPMEAVAAEVGSKVEQASNVLRTAAQQTVPNQPPAYSQDFLGAMFNAKVGDAVAGSQSGPPGVVIAKLTKIQEPPAPMLAAYADAARRTTTSALDQDLNIAARTAAVAKMKPTTDPKLARRALGLEADAPTPATPVIPGKPKG